MKRYAIIGFGCAGYTAAKTLRELEPDCQIDVYSESDTAPENPMLTTYYTAGKISETGMYPFGGIEKILQELRIRFYGNVIVERVDAAEKSVTAGGMKKEYDDIVLASGAKAFVPPIPGLPDGGVYVMRTTKDAERLLDVIGTGCKSALVVGASWVGIKVVEALKVHGISSVLADMAPYIFATACIPGTASFIHGRLQEMGIRLKFGSGIASMKKTENTITSYFTDGTAVDTDIVVLCMGVRPSLSYLDQNEIEIGRGVKVDSHMRTSAEHIYAAGDCCETLEIMSGEYMPVNLWANAFVQGRIAGRNIAGYTDEFEGALAHNIAHFLDMDFVGIGNPNLSGTLVEYGEPGKDNYVCAIVENGKLRCVNILGNYRVSGFFKRWFVWQQQNPQEKGLPFWIYTGLLREGISEEFIRLLGGEAL